MDPIRDADDVREWELADEELDRAQTAMNTSSTGGGASIVCVYGSASCAFSRP